MRKEIRNKITITSFFYAIVMVFYHFNYGNNTIIIFEDHISKISNLLNNWCQQSGTYAVSFFYTTSAYLLYYNLSDDNLLDKLKRRVYSLLIPFVIWNIIYLLLFNIDEITNPEFIIGILASKYCGVLWFVEGLLVLLLFIKPLRFLMSKKIVSFLLIVFFLLCNFRGWHNIIPENSFFLYIDIWRFMGYIPSYLMGVYLALNCGTKIIDKKWPAYIVVISYILFLFPVLLEDTHSIWFKMLSVVHPICLWIISSFFSGINEIPHYILKESFMIYVLHIGCYQVYNYILRKLSWFQFSERFHDEIDIRYLMMFRLTEGTIVVATCIGMIAILRNCFPKIAVVLSGNR